MTATILHVWRKTDVSLEDALSAAGACVDGSTAMLSSASSFVIARVSGKSFEMKEPLDGDVFEARCFGPLAELRWLRTPDSLAAVGTAVLLSEDKDAAKDFGAACAPVAAVDTISVQYLLWGQLENGQSTAGWRTVSTARIGSFAVPFEGQGVAKGRRLALRAREYVSVEGDHGNSYVAEERLIDIQAAED